MKKIFLPLVVLLLATSPARPASLNIQTDCGATPDDDTDDTLAIRSCLELEPRELVIPIGVFLVDRLASNQPAAIDVAKSDTLVRGEGSGSVIRLIRDANGFSGSRVLGIRPTTFGTDVERVTVRDLTIDGGRDDASCFDAKHTPGSNPPDGRGQQGHGIFMGAGCSGGANEEGCTDYVRDIRIQNVTFTGLSGDAIYLYNNVENLSIESQTIGGWCRAGVAVNAYEDCDGHIDESVWDEQEVRRGTNRPFIAGLPPRGVRNVTLRNLTLVADDTATQGARGLDVEPNAKVCDITLEGSRLDEAEIGGARRLKVLRNTFDRTGAQLGGAIQLVSIVDAVVDGNTVRTEDLNTPPIYARIIERGVFENNVVRTPYDISGIQVSNNGTKMSRDITLRANVVEHTGGISTKFALYTAGVRGRLDVVDNTFKGFQHGVHYFGGDDVLADGNIFEVAQTANHFRVGTGEGRIKKVRVAGNRGAALKAYDVYGPLDEFRDCGDDMTGSRFAGGNESLPCSPAEAINAAAIDDLLTRVEVLEAQ
jgi:hypothetical protein